MDLRRNVLVVVGLGLLASVPAQAIDLFGIERRHEARRQAAIKAHQAEQLEQIRAFDRILESANRDGLAMVITQIFNTGSRANSSLREHRDYTTSVGWELEGSNGGIHLLHSDRIKTNDGFVLDTVEGNFRINLVVPGTYRLQSVMQEHHYSDTHNMTLTRNQGAGGIGIYEINETTFIETETEEYYRPTSYKTVNHSYCSASYVVSGACASWSSWSEEQVDRHGGWDTRQVGRERDGLIVVSKPRQTLATLILAPGQVALMDTVFSRLPNNGYLRDTCARTGGQRVECQLASFSFQVVPARADALQHAITMVRNNGQVELAGMLERAVPVPLQISGAKADWRDGQWGQNYYLEVPAADTGK